MSWPLVKASSVMDIRDGTHDSPKYIETGIPLVTSKNLVAGSIDYQSCQYISEEDHIAISKRSFVDNGDILYAMIGTIGNPVIVEKKMDFAIKNVALFKFNNESIFNRYVYHFLNSDVATRQLLKQSRGGTQKFVSLGNLRDLEIPLPPLAEQKRIAAILDKADAIRRKRQQAIKLADEFLRSVFLDMFGDPVSNPKGWEVKTLKELATKIGSGSTPKGGKTAYITSGISLIRSLNIHDDKFLHKDLAFITEKQANELANVVIEKNDVLLNITGASVCRCAIVDNLILPARVNQHVCILRLPSVEPEYLLHTLISSSYKQNLWRIAQSAGATREALTKEQVENLRVAIPPKELQVKFANIKKKVKAMLLTTQCSSDFPLFNSLSQKAFSGNL